MDSVCVPTRKKWWEMKYCPREDTVRDIHVIEVQLSDLSLCS